MSEGRRERATQWFNFRFLLTKANSAGNYSSVVPNLGSFSFSCLKNKIAIYNFWASKILSPVVLFSLPHCVLTSAQSVRSNNSGASHERSTMKHNGLLWISPRCYILLCTSSRTDYKFHIRGIDLRQEFFKHLKQQSLYQKQNKILCFCCLFSYRLNVSKQSQQVAVSKRGDPWRHGLLVY